MTSRPLFIKVKGERDETLKQWCINCIHFFLSCDDGPWKWHEQCNPARTFAEDLCRNPIELGIDLLQKLLDLVNRKRTSA